MFPRSFRGFLVVALIAGPGCVAGDLRDRYAAAVDAYQRTPSLPAESPAADPAHALGPPDGRTVAVGVGGAVTLRFFREIPDGLGPDLRVYEVGPDGAAARIAVSEDGRDFRELAELASGPTTEYDLAAVELAHVLYVRVTGTDDLGLEPGFDLDAVEALQ